MTQITIDDLHRSRMPWGYDMRAVELFAGAGGLALGVSRAGFAHDAVVELNPYACETLRENKERGVEHVRDWPIIEQDVCKFDFSEIKDGVDLLAAGVPCQPFSFAGKGLGQFDKRNMFPEVTRAVRALKPKAVLIENVKGLTRPSFQAYLNYILFELSLPEVKRRPDEAWEDHYQRLERHCANDGRVRDLEYSVFPMVLNAGDYGVPQWRERIFIVAFRTDLGLVWEPPKPTHSLDALLWSQWRTNEYWERHGLPRPRERAGYLSVRFARRVETLDKLSHLKDNLLPWLTIRDAFEGLPILREGEESSEVLNHFLNPGARAYRKHTGSPMDEPAKTLKAGSHGVPGGENSLALGDGHVRYFSVRECARIQTFPDDFVFQRVWTQGMRQVGNAVPVHLGEIVARSVAAQLREALVRPKGRTSCGVILPTRARKQAQQAILPWSFDPTGSIRTTVTG